MNILIKLTCLIGLVIAPILGGHTEDDIPNTEGTAAVYNSSEDKYTVETKVDMYEKDKQTVAEVEVISSRNGKDESKSYTFTGTEAEVKAKIENLKK